MGVLALLAAYVLGSTPTSYVAGRALKGIDLRSVGSGNLGATNVYRTLGAPAAVVVLAVDMLKGFAPTWWFASWFALGESAWWPAALGVVSILGHVRPYLGLFRGGGKGVATASGVFMALSPLAFGIALSVFVLVVVLTRFVSLGSMLGAVTLAIASLALYGADSYRTWLGTAVAALVLWTHRANIGRLRRGEESRIGRPAVRA